MNHLAEAWVQAWNNHDLDAIMEHYADDIVFYSPFIKRINNDPSGRITGKAALRAYFERALVAYPELYFDLYHVLESVDSVTLYYQSVGNRLAAEMMVVDGNGKVKEVRAHYKEQ